MIKTPAKEADPDKAATVGPDRNAVVSKVTVPTLTQM
jgi:hypothetical protein